MVNKKYHVFDIWTDGSCRVNSDKTGSWAYLIVNNHGDVLVSESGVVLKTTPPAMELMAAIKGVKFALEFLPHGELTVHSDCELVIKGMTDWVPKWKANNWKTSAGTIVKNKNMWQHLDHLTDVIDVNFNWVKGHNGMKYNEKVHDMAYNLLKNDK